MMKICLLACSILLITATVAAQSTLPIEQLNELERQWAESREALNAYHIIQRSRHPRHGPDAPWRQDTFIRLGNALHHAFHHEDRPDQQHESVTLEEDGQFVELRPGGITTQDFLGISGRGLGRVFVTGADRVTLLAHPPDSETWEFILHSGAKTDHYVVHAATGAVLQREARDPGGLTTYIETRTPLPLNTADADSAIRDLVSRAETAQQQRDAEAEPQLTHANRGIWTTWAFILFLLAAASRWLLRTLPAKARHLWPMLTAAIAGMILISFSLLEALLLGHYTMLLTAIADLPVSLLNLPRSIAVYNVLNTLIHALPFAALYLAIAWTVTRTISRRLREKELLRARIAPAA